MTIAFTAEHEALRASFSTPEIDGLIAEMEKAVSGLPLFTRSNFMTLIASAEGTPYKYGGIDPFHGGADCSGLIYWAGLQCGVVLPRTTTAEWAGLPHILGEGLVGIVEGDIPEFDVPGDGGNPPQHVGVFLSAGTMIDDPETGQNVSVQSIPVTKGIWPYGYCRLPFAASPTPAPPPAPPTAAPQEVQNLLAEDTETEGLWYIDPRDGHSEAYNGAPFLGGLNTLNPNPLTSGVGTLAGACAARDGNGQIGLCITLARPSAAAPAAANYLFPRNGQYASKLTEASEALHEFSVEVAPAGE